jgi:hypothetical protein
MLIDWNRWYPVPDSNRCCRRERARFASISVQHRQINPLKRLSMLRPTFMLVHACPTVYIGQALDRGAFPPWQRQYAMPTLKPGPLGHG